MTTAPRPANILFATLESGGTFTPALTVARRLIEAGHRVRIMSDRCNADEARASGAGFTPWTRAPSRPNRSPATDIMRDWEAASPIEGFRRLIARILCGPALAYGQDLMDELAREPADLVVGSDMLLGVTAACEALGQRHAILTANLSIFPLPGVPPLGAGLAPARTDADRALHDAIAADCTALFDQGLPALNAARAAFNLPPLEHVADQAQRAQRILLGTSRAFDFAPAILPERVRYVGPQLGTPGWAAPWASPWPEGDLRPLLVVGFSTTFQDHGAVLQRVMDAAATLPVRVLVTLGGAIPATSLRAPANAVLVYSAPHDELMWDAAIVVTHGGHGTVLRALRHHRPMLIIPHGRDQADNAVRVTERGAGLDLAANAGTAQIHAALSRLLDEPAFHAAAGKLGRAVAAGADSTAVLDEIAALLTPVTAPRHHRTLLAV